MTKKIKVITADSLIFIVAIFLIILLSVLSLRIGSVEYTTKEILNSLFDKDSVIRVIVMDLRLPRVILCIVVGMSLAAAGALLQAVMQNPLADPGVIGVSSGASVVATFVFLVFPNALGGLPIFAFLGALFSCFLIYILSWKKGFDPLRVLLAGIAINSIFGGISSFLTLMNSDDLQGVLSWLNGSMSAKSWYQVKMMLPYSVIGLIISFFCIKTANILLLGEDMAKNLGINVNLSRFLLSAVGAFLAGVTVASVGMIGFIGLIVPHITRMFIGSNYNKMLPLSMLIGSSVMLFADLVGRTIVSPIEIPVGIIMAVLGGPFFLYLLKRGEKKVGN